MVMHFDNTTLYTTKCTIDYLRANRLTRAPHPAFSPDLAPSDFYLFGKLKMALIGAAFADNELLQGVMEVLNEISREELEAVFEEWLLRLDRRIQQNGEYVE
jgi:histone-lysine N-methyltransferase SETMAR